MRRLAAILYSLISTMLASSFVVLVLAAPLAWGIARRIAGDD